MRRRAALSLALLAAIGVAAVAWWLTRPADSRGDAEAAQKTDSPEVPIASAPGLVGTKAHKRAGGGQPGEAGEEAAGSDQSAEAPSNGALVVRVSGKGAPLAGARVRVQSASDTRAAKFAMTSADGSARFDGVDRSSAVIEVLAEGFMPLHCERGWTVDGNAWLLELWPGVPIDGRVIDVATGDPIPNASVTIFDDAACEVGPTDALGKFHISGIRDGCPSRLVAFAKGFVANRAFVSVVEGKPEPTETVIRLNRGGVLVGVVVTADGTPAPGALVLVRHDRPEGADLIQHFEGGDYLFQHWYREDEIQGTSGLDGAFRADGLAFDESYTATATAPGQASATSQTGIRVTAEAPESHATFTLRRPMSVRVHVTVPDGAALPESLRVRVFQEDLLYEPNAQDPEGTFRFQGLGAGLAHAFAQAEGYRSVAKEFRVEEGVAGEVDLPLDAGAVVEGGVDDTGGKPLPYARVVVAPLDRNWEESPGRMLMGGRETRTDEAGKFSVGGLIAGDVVVAAEWGEDSNEPSLATRERLVLKAPVGGLRIVLSRLGRIRLLLRTPDGAPFKGTAKTSLRYGMGSRDQGSEVEDGFVQVTSVDDGEYQLAVQPKGFGWIHRRVEIRDGAAVDLGVVVLDPGMRVSGSVVDGTGHPVPGAYVWCAEVESLTANTDAEGRFAFERFPREPSLLSAEAEGFSEASVTVEASRATNIEIRLPRPAKLRGTIKTGAGAPAPGHEIDLRRGDSRPVYRTTFVAGVKGREIYYYGGSMGFESGDDGRFEIDVAPGRWSAHVVDPAGKDVALGEWTVTGGETREIEIVLPAK